MASSQISVMELKWLRFLASGQTSGIVLKWLPNFETRETSVKSIATLRMRQTLVM